MFKWLSEKRDLNFAKKGSIGGTADFFCIGYWSCIQSITLEEIRKNSIIDNSLLRHLTVKYKKLDIETEYFKEKDSNEKKK